MAFDMSTDMAVPTYIIYRDTPSSDPFDLTAPPVFFPPKDSDALFDALRAKYPHVKSHSERMRDAMIDFLIDERQAAQSEQVPVPVPAQDLIDPSVLMDVPTASPLDQPSWPSSMSSSGSTSLLSSPDTLHLATPSFSMSPQVQDHPLARFPTATSTTPASPASQDPTSGGPSTGGLSPPALEQMTGVFSVSAAAQPKQRVRRKMTEAEKADYRKRRIAKACDKCQKRKRKCTHNQPEMETVAATQRVNKTNKPRARPQAQAAEQSFGESALDDLEFERNFGFDPSIFGTDMQLFDDDVMELQQPYRFGQQVQTQQFGTIPTVTSWDGHDQQRHTQDVDHLFGLDGSTDMTHVPVHGRSGSYGSTGSGAPHPTSPQPSRPPWSKMVLQLTGTHKAIKAFGQLSTSPRARTALQSVPIGKAASLISHGISQHVVAGQDTSIQPSGSVHDPGLPSTPTPKKVFHPTCASARAGAPLSWAGRTGCQDGPRLEVEGLPDTAHDRLLHGSVSAAATSSTSRSGKGPASPSAPVSGPGSLLEKSSDPAHHQGRLDWGTLGEGIDRVPSPSAEMFLLRRRIVDRNHSRRLAVEVPRSTYGTKANLAHMDGVGAFATATPVVRTCTAYPARSGPDDDPAQIVGDLARKPSKDGQAHAILAPAPKAPVTPKPPNSRSTPSPSHAQDRLSDHVTYRDHFGRPHATPSRSGISSITTTLLALLAALLLLTRLVNPTLLLLLALTSTHHDCWSNYAASLVQCTTKNSSWLGSRLLRAPKSESCVVERGGRGGVR
ncbi:hypothetical protein Tdes44962_MAKER03908 [Teratosphaeria destructans]|uniref:Uncharacterized protein n=1 Tax=Teratosphaeria destructans TaxID=418781 RepID=A0A9W7W118_9PEZI|nr:hypothetical protein Tdes44962_MAKER03908 [Teratosphaeria destructans]